MMLARWRAAAERASEVDTASPNVVERAAEVQVAPAALEQPASAPDEVAALAQLEEELERAVAAPAAETIARLLAAPRAAFSRERTAESRAELLAGLDVVEDFLDAVLLTGVRGAREREQP